MKIHNVFKRNQNSYKNNFGHVLVIAGSYNMPGACVLCANAAITSGAGLVTVAFPKEAYPVIAKHIKPEIMLLPLETKNKQLTKNSKNKLLNFIEKRKITSVAIGCGMGKSSSLKNLILSIIKKFNIYTIIDADGLNSLQCIKNKFIIKGFQSAKSKIIITPHPKEFEKISSMKYKSQDKYRKQVTKTFAKNNDIICVLKGHKTVVSDGKRVYINNTGNAGMATAGSGDVLTGMVAAIVCNKNNNLLLKVSTAVYLHGLAGDFAAKEKSQVSMTASDIIDNIYKALKKLITI